MYCPKVSIVIPVYNGSNFLSEAINSALAQTYPNIEIIVVNDGSKDHGATAEIAAGYGDKIRYFEKENGGSSSALNLGIRNMTGEWFSWLSHDDLYEPEKVKSQIEYLISSGMSEEQYHGRILFSGSELIDEQGNLLRRVSQEKMVTIAAEITAIQNVAYLIAQPRKWNFHGCSCLVHRSAFEKVGLFDENLRILNDVEFWFRLYSAGYLVAYVPEILVKGRIHPKQVGRNIGYSAKHPENDMLWKRRLEWLNDNTPNNARVYELLGRDAYLSARYEDGKKAYGVLEKLEPKRRPYWKIQAASYALRAHIRTIGKKIYLAIK